MVVLASFITAGNGLRIAGEAILIWMSDWRSRNSRPANKVYRPEAPSCPWPGHFTPTSTERRHVAGLPRPNGLSRQHAGAPGCRRFVRGMNYPGQKYAEKG
jgi:hypothetical protein